MNRKIRKVLLINPPSTRPGDYSQEKCRISVFVPLGLAYIAAVIEQEGYNVKILDSLLEGINNGEQQYGNNMLRYGLSDSELEEIISREAPDIIGISCLYSNKDWDMRNSAKIAKSVFPACPVVVGGVHPTAIARELLEEEKK